MREHCPVCFSMSRIDDWKLTFVVPDDWTLPEENLVCLCKNCGMIWYDNNKTQQDYDTYYKEHYDLVSKNIINGDRSRLEDIEDIITNGQSLDKNLHIVDFGGGSGYLESALKRDGYKCVETVEVGDTMPKDIDMVVVANVLEHIYNLYRVMVKIKNSLKPGGKVFVEVPDAQEMVEQSKLLPMLDYHQKHINHFSSSQVDLLFKTYGFKRIYSSTITYDYNNIPVYRAIYELTPPSMFSPYTSAAFTIASEVSNLISKLEDIAKPVIVWGCGDFCMHMLSLVDLNVIYFVDNEPHFKGATIKGKPVYDTVISDEPILVMVQGQKEELVKRIKRGNLKNELIIL